MKKGNLSVILFRVITVILLLIWFALIFFLSSQNAFESASVSGGLIKALVKLFEPGISPDKLALKVEDLQFIVRKAAHFSIFAGLGFFSFLSVVSYRKLSLATRTAISMFIGLSYAVSDEYHQTLISGRSGEITDILIDFSGVMFAILILVILVLCRRRIKFKGALKLQNKKSRLLIEDLQKQISDLKNTVNELKNEKNSLSNTVDKLNNDKKVLETRLNLAEASLKDKEKKAEEPSVADDVRLGAQIIGKIVVSATKYCNDLSAENPDIDKKELINLILGRTEVAKSEILKIVYSDFDFDAKKNAMEKEFSEAEDYFKSVAAQNVN